MKITTNAHLLSSLNGLVDPNQRQQQQSVQDQQNLAKKQSRETTEVAGKAAQNQDRQERIDANRKALKDLQDRLKADKIDKLKQEFSVEDQGGQSAPNLNLRENLGSSKPVDTRPGQIVDIRV